jgi:DNA-binding transcriptional MocR family regulator
VSRFTVVEAYERLVAQGYLDSRRGSGFYVCERGASPQGLRTGDGRSMLDGVRQAAQAAQAAAAPLANAIDVVWLLRNMLHTTSPEKGPGLGYLPNRWLDGELVANAMRAIGRQGGAQTLLYGTAQGFYPLRQQLQTRLAELEIGVTPEQIMTVSGVTQAIDLIARIYVQPGDSVLVGDPGWFQMFGRFASQGARLIGMPYTPQGPDLDALQQLMETWRPRLMVLSSVCQNPTATSLSAAQAFQILRLAEEYDVIVVEDDIYGDFSSPGQPVARLATLDQLKRVIYLNSFSKTLAANLRVGFLAASPEVVRAVADQKMLVTFATPEINERIVFKILTEGHYRRHVERLRARLDTVREKAARALERVGFRLFCTPGAGMFLWADTGVDSGALTAAAHDAGYLLAPGSLFSPNQSPSTFMRFNIANCGDPGLMPFFERYLDKS